MTDPVADMFNRIRNVQAVSGEAVQVSYSKLKLEILKILEERGFLERMEIKGRKAGKMIKIFLRYDAQKKPAIERIKLISKPGQRIYKGFREIKKVRSGYGIMILSTSSGLMAGDEARKKKLGGEVICEVW